MKFNKPTLITLTAPTCSGKSYLLKHLDELGFQRIVSTTTRAPRDGEVEGVDYHFITREQSLALDAGGAFAEIIEFRGTRYGVTHSEMAEKMQGDAPPVVILEPQGLTAYEAYCIEQGWDIFKVFVSTPEDVRIKRLNDRTVTDIEKYYINADYLKLDIVTLQKLISTHTDRLMSITGDERFWIGKSKWDAIVDGQRIEHAINDIKQGIKWRNSRNAEATT